MWVTMRHGAARLLLCATALGAALAANGAQATAANIGYEWFWNRVPARIDHGPRTDALALAAGRATNATADRARHVLSRWRAQLEVAAHAARVSEALLAALVSVESAGGHRAVSPAGAQGLGQLMPGTARSLGVRDSFAPLENLRGAALYLSDLIDLFDGDLVLALAAYNAGEGAVTRWRGVPPYAETRAYVPRVLGAYAAVGRFCVGEAAADPRAPCRLPDDF